MVTQDQVNQGTSSIIENVISRYTSNFSINGNQKTMAEIGRPCSFPNSIDPGQEMYEYFKSIMNIIDIIPCTYKINFNNIDQGLKGYLPQIDYETDYSYLCECYGLPSAFGLRLYGTDDTTAADIFSNKSKPNFFQSGVNKLSSIGQNFQDILSSLDSTAVEDATNWTSDFVNSHINFGNEKITGLLKNSVSLLSDVVGAGHKISLPGIWSDSTFSPNFTTTVKLVSPYGHPSAIKEFIIKPLMYLLLLTTPESDDGVSYGRPLFCTIQGYGLSTIPLGQISDITLRRGGSNSSFNIYRQPLTIDVSIQFSNLVEGFAHISADAIDTEDTVYTWADEPLDDIPTFDDTSVNTVTSFMYSLFPRSGVERSSNFIITGANSTFQNQSTATTSSSETEIENIADPIQDSEELAINIESQEQTSDIMDNINSSNTDPNLIYS